MPVSFRALFVVIDPQTLRMRGIPPYDARLKFDRTTGLLTTLTDKERRQVRPTNTVRFTESRFPTGSPRRRMVS